jgi:hypothetical protein
MPGARCARSLACKSRKHASKSPRSRRVARHSPRNGFNGFLRALPGDRALLPPSPPRSLLPRNLTPASGRQDHTTSPSATKRFRQRAVCVHRIPCPTSVTIAKRPSVWDGMAGDAEVIWVGRERKYFCKGGWTCKSLFCFFVSAALSTLVIPGCATWRRPGIHTPRGGYGFRARASRAPE